MDIKKENVAVNPAEPKKLGKQDVYNLMIEDIPVYFAENILVHNCSDSLRYSIFSYFHAKDGEGGISVRDWRALKYKQSGNNPKNIDDFMKPGW